jgi:hypothetical protein
VNKSTWGIQAGITIPYALFSETVEFKDYPGNQERSYSMIETHKRFFYANDSTGDQDICCFYYHGYYPVNSILTGPAGKGGYGGFDLYYAGVNN